MATLSEEIKASKFKNEYEKLIVNLLFTSNYVRDVHNTKFKGFGISSPQYNVLRILRGQHPNPVSVNLIIERMLDKSSNASRLVDRLEQKGLVNRKRSPKDRRIVDIVITEEGLNLLATLDPILESVQADMCNLTDEESAQLNELLDKLRS